MASEGTHSSAPADAEGQRQGGEGDGVHGGAGLCALSCPAASSVLQIGACLFHWFQPGPLQPRWTVRCRPSCVAESPPGTRRRLGVDDVDAAAGAEQDHGRGSPVRDAGAAGPAAASRGSRCCMGGCSRCRTTPGSNAASPASTVFQGSSRGNSSKPLPKRLITTLGTCEAVFLGQANRTAAAGLEQADCVHLKSSEVDDHQ